MRTQFLERELRRIAFLVVALGVAGLMCASAMGNVLPAAALWLSLAPMVYGLWQCRRGTPTTLRAAERIARQEASKLWPSDLPDQVVAIESRIGVVHVVVFAGNLIFWIGGLGFVYHFGWDWTLAINAVGVAMMCTLTMLHLAGLMRGHAAVVVDWVKSGGARSTDDGYYAR